MINGVEVYNWLHYVPNDLFTFRGHQSNRLAPYLALATQYGWANYFFQTNQGPSMPAHQFLFSGTSAPTAPPNALFAAENPGGNTEDRDTACTADPGKTVAVIDNSGKEDTNPQVYPCFEHRTLTDVLDRANLSWKYYAIDQSGIWTAPNAIAHICLPTSPVDGTCTGYDWTHYVLPYIGTGKVLTDLGVNGTDNSACQLPAVSWVIPDGTWSDHGGYTGDGQGFGPSWVADIVDAVGGYDNTQTKLQVQCGYWNNTAILVTWDDWGGWYDHVEPFKVLINSQNNPCTVWGCGYVYGFRVPFLFVSGYTPQGFVSGTVNPNNTTTCTDTLHCYDFGSILRYIETNFNLPEIAEQNFNYADHFAHQLDTAFYSGRLRQFQPIPTPVPPGCFINPEGQGCFPNYTGPVDPDDDAIEPSN